MRVLSRAGGIVGQLVEHFPHDAFESVDITEDASRATVHVRYKGKPDVSEVLRCMRDILPSVYDCEVTAEEP